MTDTTTPDGLLTEADDLAAPESNDPLAEAEADIAAGAPAEFDGDKWIEDGRTLATALTQHGASEAAQALQALGPVAANDAALAFCRLPDSILDAAQAADLLHSREAWAMLARLGEHTRNSLNIKRWADNAMDTTDDRSATTDGARPDPDAGLVQRALKLKRSEAYRDNRHIDHRRTVAAVQGLLKQATGEVA